MEKKRQNFGGLKNNGRGGCCFYRHIRERSLIWQAGQGTSKKTADDESAASLPEITFLRHEA